MEVSLSLDGGPELERALKKLTVELRDEMLLEAMLAAGEPIRFEASSRAPRRTGRLAADIVVNPGQKQTPSVRIGVGVEGWYGGFVERGTGPRKTIAGANRGKVTAQPFLKPAFDAQKGAALEKFREVIRTRLGMS